MIAGSLLERERELDRLDTLLGAAGANWGRSPARAIQALCHLRIEQAALTVSGVFTYFPRGVPETAT